MNEYLIQGQTLNNLADSIRNLNGSEETLKPNEMINEINTGRNTILSLTEMLINYTIGGNDDIVDNGVSSISEINNLLDQINGEATAI